MGSRNARARPLPRPAGRGPQPERRPGSRVRRHETMARNAPQNDSLDTMQRAAYLGPSSNSARRAERRPPMKTAIVLVVSFVLWARPAIGSDSPILAVQLEVAPSGPAATLDQITVRIEQGRVDGFAVISEPSHTLLGVVLDSESTANVSELEKSDWFVNDVAPFLALTPDSGPRRARALDDTNSPPRCLPAPFSARMSAPLRSGATVVFQHGRRSPDDNRLIFSTVGDSLASWKGDRVVRATLIRPQGPAPFIQSFALLARRMEARRPLNEGVPYTCGCGSNQPSPCGTGSGNCSCCSQCTEKRDGPWCACSLRSTTQCPGCQDNFECLCSGYPPYC